MRISIDHRTRYTFSEPQARVVQLLRMTPQDDGAQSVIDWSIDVDCDARLRRGTDGYGNISTMLYVDGPVDHVEIVVRGEAVTYAHAGPLTGTVETLPPVLFLRQTGLTRPDEAIRNFVSGVCGAVASPQRRAETLNIALFERLGLRAGRSPKARTAAEAFAQGEASTRDAAQVMIAAARAAGLPARFVSGHCLDGPNVRNHRSAHCWVEVHVEDLGWFGFDPSMGRQPGETYVRVAIGLDASDSTPLSGTRMGGGIEELDVAVHVEAGQSQ
ncbi:MAG: transglutaminase family protein [Sphingomonadales bacterium]|jgi:transglutaminase-like putative cysteine protease|nr:transglutaminase family protein [Sphingomonadales bacterium]